MLNNAKWITYDPENTKDLPENLCIDYRNTLKLDQPSQNIESATVCASAIGLYMVTINQNKITDSIFNPGWTNYRTRIQYQTYDVKNLLAQNNSISILSANGWAVKFRSLHRDSSAFCLSSPSSVAASSYA